MQKDNRDYRNNWVIKGFAEGGLILQKLRRMIVQTVNVKDIILARA